MANRSNFPQSIDVFIEHYDIQASEKSSVLRYQELKLKPTLTTSEQLELSDLTTVLRDKIFTPEDFNKLQDCITNLEIFFRDNVDDYIVTKQNDVSQTVINAKNDVQASKNSALQAIEDKKADIIEYMDSTTAGAIRNDMGVMGELLTFDKSSLVNAINEVLLMASNSYIDGGIF